MPVAKYLTKMSSKNIVFGMLILFIFSSFVFAIEGSSYDLSTAANEITGGSQILSVAVDEKHDLVYIGTSDNKFGYYNESSNSTVVLSSIMSAWTTAEYYDITFDNDRNIVYVTNGGDPTKFGYYNLTSNTTVFLGNLWNYPARIEYDNVRDVVWYASNDGDFGYVELDGTKVQKALPSSSSVSDLCLDTVDNRVYVTSIGGARIPFYYSIANDSIVDLSTLQPNIYSCDIGYDWHYVFFSAGEDFSYSSIYRPLTGENKVILYSGDLNQFPDIQYMQHTKTVAMTEYSVFDPEMAGRIYNISANTSTYIRAGDLDDWMTGSWMTDGDYMVGSRRYYIGFSDGRFGFYDNNFSTVPFVPLPIPPLHTQQLVTDFINGSTHYLDDLPLFVRVKFVSWNESTDNITILINGTYETSAILTNNTFYDFEISSIQTTNLTGKYILGISGKYEMVNYTFFITERKIPISNTSLIAVVLLLISCVYIMAYLGTSTQNEIIRMLLNTMSLLSLTGISFIALLITKTYNLGDEIEQVVFYFVVLFGTIFAFMFVLSIYYIIIYVLNLIAQRKAKKEELFPNRVDR